MVMTETHTKERPRRKQYSAEEAEEGIEEDPNYYRMEYSKEAETEEGIRSDFTEEEVEILLEQVYNELKETIESKEEEIDLGAFEDSDIEEKGVKPSKYQRGRAYKAMNSYELQSEDLSVAIYVDHLKSQEKNDKIKTYVFLDKDGFEESIVEEINEGIKEEYLN